MSKSLFEEAIADAKQLREVAEQNAKSAILEAVTPKIKQFIESQLIGDSALVSERDSHDFIMSALSESDDDGSDEDVLVPPGKAKKEKMEEADEQSDEVELSESALASLVDLFTKKNNARTKIEDLREVFNKLSAEDQIALLEMIKDDKSSNDEESMHEIDLDMQRMSRARKSNDAKQSASGDKTMSKSMKEKIYELDLDAINEDKIVIDFGNDVTLDRENPYSVLVSDSDEEEEEVEVMEPEEDEEAPPVDGESEPAPDEEGAVESAVYEIDENMLRSELFKLREAKSSKAKKAKNPAQAAADAFGGGKLQEMDKIVMNKFANIKEAYNNEVRKNRDLQQQLNEYRNGIETLREQLSDLNLFNAKLLYVNKLTQASEVTSDQRRAVVEALDGAKTLREAKIIYKSLSESLPRRNSASLTESARRLSPGQSSRPTTSGSSTRLNESTELNRWATLAGIK